MTSLTELSQWKSLQSHYQAIADTHMRALFDNEPDRFGQFSLNLDDFLFDYSKNRITTETMDLLFRLARARDVEGWRERMFSGEHINSTEDRAVLHTALRSPTDGEVMVDGENVMPKVKSVLGQMRALTVAVRGGIWKGHTGKPVTDVVNIGIGGSDLGPAMVSEALGPYHPEEIKFHFVSNVDGTHIDETLAGLNPETTLFIVASKTFTTKETMTNAMTARHWLSDIYGEDAISRHFIAVSSNRPAVTEFGIDSANMFDIWDWVGGRYSVWSAVGLPLALAIGMSRFEEFLAGAHSMDDHFRNAPLDANMPVIMALLGIWNSNFLGAQCHAILPYNQCLRLLPAYLQQADMESNGKGVTRDGAIVDYNTGPVIFGAPGTNAQHSFFQLLHQSPRLVSCDFIAAAETDNPGGEHNHILLANFFAQSEALMKGKTEAEARDELTAQGLEGDQLEDLLPHIMFAGNRPSNSILVRHFDPFTLGSLLALYEHKIFVQGVIWGINSFDQWGVELGKKLATRILAEMQSGDYKSNHDSSTNGLISYFCKLNEQ